MKHIKVIVLISLCGLISACRKDFPRQASVITTGATNITVNSATLNGKIIDMGEESFLNYGFCWSTATDPKISDNAHFIGSCNSKKSFSYLISDGLTTNTAYYARAYAITYYGTVMYGNLICFTTSPVNLQLDTLLNENFSSDLGSFSQYSVIGAEVWHWTTYSSATYAAITGYSGGANNLNEDWLISPSFNINLYTGVKLSFTSAMKYASQADNTMKFYISNDYSSGDPTAATWVEFSVPHLPDGSNWNFVPSGDIDLSALGITGTNVHIALRYTSTTAICAAWEIAHILIAGYLTKK